MRPHLQSFVTAVRGKGAGGALLCAIALAGCSTSTPVATPQFSITSDQLVGKWGLASYRAEQDRVRTQAQAKAACSNPYVIGKGANGGVMMHLADQATPQELFVKTASDGAVYIGPQGPAGDPHDRRVLSYDPTSFTALWVDPDAAKRYGTLLYVRCGAAKS
ncbi:hypothetical protein ACMDCR_01465 [Labrys okinawensis]|uniref:hypothetical protein n=1 Tax=Labrys okinawensis TaxID=346911 RepID=UPI0039BC99F0